MEIEPIQVRLLPDHYHYVQHDSEWDIWEARMREPLKEWLRECGIRYRCFDIDEVVEFDKGCSCLESYLYLELYTLRDVMMFKLAWM